MSEYKMMIVVRKDLNMRKGKMVAQGSHAAVGLALETQNSPAMKAWLKSSFKKICVSVDSEAELHEICKKAEYAGLPCKLILDAGHTEFNEPTYTCCALGPATAEALEPITGSLKLL